MLDAGERRGAEPHRHPHRARVSAARARRAGERHRLAAAADLAIAARRPSRSLRREVLQRFERRRSWRLAAAARREADGLNATAADKFEIVLRRPRVGSARRSTAARRPTELLARIRDDVGLGAALATLDLSGKGPDASHRDDLNALIAVATFEPDPAAFEPWLRARLRDPNERARDDGVAVSTVHRVKGMEWPYVVVLGAHDGLMPHALADDIEEERRIFHVAITRGDTAVHVVADAQRPAPFLDELPRPRPPATSRRGATADVADGEADARGRPDADGPSRRRR